MERVWPSGRWVIHTVHEVAAPRRRVTLSLVIRRERMESSACDVCRIGCRWQADGRVRRRRGATLDPSEHQGVAGLGLDRGVIDQAQRGLKELSRRHEIAWRLDERAGGRADHGAGLHRRTLRGFEGRATLAPTSGRARNAINRPKTGTISTRPPMCC